MVQATQGKKGRQQGEKPFLLVELVRRREPWILCGEIGGMAVNDEARWGIPPPLSVPFPYQPYAHGIRPDRSDDYAEMYVPIRSEVLDWKAVLRFHGYIESPVNRSLRWLEARQHGWGRREDIDLTTDATSRSGPMMNEVNWSVCKTKQKKQPTTFQLTIRPIDWNLGF